MPVSGRCWTGRRSRRAEALRERKIVAPVRLEKAFRASLGLSADPLEPATGAAWARNPYSFAGNDPLHATDPMGLHPVTDAELREYNSNNGVGGFVKNNWEYIAAGALVVAGGVLMATGVGGPAGMMLISAGTDAIIQKATTGEVNWGQVAISGTMGAIPFGAVVKGARGAMMATRAGPRRARP